MKSSKVLEAYRVDPGGKVDLGRYGTSSHDIFKGGKPEAKAVEEGQRKELWDLQNVLYAQHEHKVLVVIQAMDTGGKDSTIKHVFKGVNPQGVRVVSFKQPTSEELDHDYLWRVHRRMPKKGELVIFNRSHYEDVLIVRVHNTVPEKVWKRRYEDINNFEKMLVNEGTTIIKFFLHISKKEQKKRLEARLEKPHKMWKFSRDDLRERKYWSRYQRAYGDALSRTSTPWAPWYVIPADRKWFRNLAVSSVIVDTLKTLKMKYPPPPEGLDGIKVA